MTKTLLKKLKNLIKNRSITPATNIIAVPIGKKTSEEPRSGCFNINKNGKAVIPIALKNTPGINISSFGLVKKSARAKINANLANSDG